MSGTHYDSEIVPTTLLETSVFKITRNLIVLSVAILCSGCITSPYWHQTFPDHNAPIPFQSWTTDGFEPVAIECSPANRSGLLPNADGNWEFYTHVIPDIETPTLDSEGGKMFSAGESLFFTTDCWTRDARDGKWYIAIRAHFVDRATGNRRPFITFDKAGLACLGETMGRSRKFYNVRDNCHYQVSGQAATYVIFKADR